MTHYIDKAALVAEIENKINKIDLNSIEDWRYRLQREHDIEVMKNIISIINTFEVKEVDLEKETHTLWSLNQESADSLFIPMNYNGLRGIAKHFFELGLKATQKEVDVEKALSDLDKDIKEFVTTKEFENESTTAGHYWVIAKHAFLLGLKAQKGE